VSGATVRFRPIADVRRFEIDRLFCAQLRSFLAVSVEWLKVGG